MIGVQEWMKTHFSTTAILRVDGGDGYRDKDDAWFEPIATSKTKKLGVNNLDPVSTVGLDVHSEYSVCEKIDIEREGQIFYLCKAL
eukprot:5501129-Prymnesium_polylepis.1